MIDLKEVVPIGTTSLFLDVPYYIYRGAGEDGKKEVVLGGTTSWGVLGS